MLKPNILFCNQEMDIIFKQKSSIMTRITLLSIFLILFSTFLIGCEDTNPASPTLPAELVPGQLDVHFTRNVTIPEANAFLTDLSLQPIDLSNLESRVESNWTCVGVPEGQEKVWVKRLIHYPHINSARQKTRTTRID